uniref:glucuronosyltransferase n=1 Tax=Ascaris lumbricoides TaxID=6252 RepID=A0A9J2Q7Y8_ASCLU
MEKIKALISIYRYAENSRQLRDRLRKYPVEAKTLFVKWSEYMAEFGNFPDLNLQGAEIGKMMMKFLPYVSIIIFSSVVYSKQMKFLFYSPAWGHSHISFLGALADILVDARHIAHVIIPEYDPYLKGNGTTKAQRVIRIAPSIPSPYHDFDIIRDPFMKNISSLEGKHFGMITNMTLIFCLGSYKLAAPNMFLSDILNNKALVNELRAEHYDIGFTEFYDYCPFGVLHHVGVKSIALLSAVPITDLLAENWGLPSPSSYVIDLFKAFVDAPQLSALHRLQNFIFTVVARNIYYRKMLAAQNSAFKEIVGQDFPDLAVLARNAAIAFINVPQIVAIPRPISGKIVFVGGIAMKKSSNLSKEFAEIFDRPNSRVVLFSLGSITKARLMPMEMKMAFLEAFARFPEYDFIFKVDNEHFENDHLVAQYRNVHAFRWIDQVSVLHHPSTKAFITHSGLNSISEGLFSGVPLICIPLFADQEYNAVMAVRKNVAVYIDKNAITTEIIVDALDKDFKVVTVCGCKKQYAENSRQLRDRLHKYPVKATTLFVKWSEYMAEFGNFPDLNLFVEEVAQVNFILFCTLAFELRSVII